MMTPGYFFFSSRPTFDIDQRSGRWSFVFFRCTAHMTTALTPADLRLEGADVVLRDDDLHRDDGPPLRVLLELVVHVEVLVALVDRDVQEVDVLPVLRHGVPHLHVPLRRREQEIPRLLILVP